MIVRRLWAGLCVLGLIGCNTQEGPVSTADGAAPVGSYAAMTSGSPDAMLLHMDALREQFTHTLEPSPRQARAATAAFTKAVVDTARAILGQEGLLPQQATKATDALMIMLASQMEKDPTSFDTLIEVADEVIQKFPNTQAATSAAFSKANALGTAPASRFESYDKRLDRLVPAVIQFGRCDPPLPQAIDMVLKLARETENTGRVADAKALHEVLIEKFANDERAQDSPDRLRRFEQFGRVIEDFKGKGVDGKPVNLDDLRGKVVLIDFWGSWCDPCVAGIPELKRMRETLGDKGFEVLGVMTDPAVIGEVFLKKHKINWPQINEEITDDPTSLQHRFGVSFFPTYLVVDREGKLVGSTNEGYVVEAMVMKAMGLEAPPSTKGPAPGGAAPAKPAG